jgi:hypothetical protein
VAAAGVKTGSKDPTSSPVSEQGSFTKPNMNRQVANSLARGVSIMKKRPNQNIIVSPIMGRNSKMLGFLQKI